MFECFARVRFIAGYMLVLLLPLWLLGCGGKPPVAPRLTVDRETAMLETLVAWPDAEDVTVLALATQYFASRRNADAMHYFEARAAAAPGRPLFLALVGTFQARMADDVPLLSRVAWVEDALQKLDRAASADRGISRVMRALVLARLPERFGRAREAVAELTWATDAPDSFLARADVPPSLRVGLRRAALGALGAAQSTLGDARASADALARSGVKSFDAEAPILTTAYSVTRKDGFRFGAPRLWQPTPDVWVASGYDFADIGFVVTDEGVVVIDAGTTERTAAAALADFRARVSNAPLRAIILTHAHWDHLGGMSAFYRDGLEIVAQAGFAEELHRIQSVGARATFFFGEDAPSVKSLDVVPTRLVSTRETLTFGRTAFELVPVHGGETDDALLVHLPGSRTVFVGDAFMPYLGAPFVAEGSPEELLRTIDVVQSLSPSALVHGHAPLTEFYTPAVLAPLHDALTTTHRETLAGLSAGLPLRELLDRATTPESLARHPNAALPFVLMRDAFITRMQRQHTGYWQPDREGVEPRSRADEAVALLLVADGDEGRITRAAESLVARGDHTLALSVAEAGLHGFPTSVELRALRARAIDGLREKNQQINPFKFIVYSELGDIELPALDAARRP